MNLRFTARLAEAINRATKDLIASAEDGDQLLGCCIALLLHLAGRNGLRRAAIALRRVSNEMDREAIARIYEQS